ncbi:MAG TPA: pathogenicity [Xylella taiwanensis]
MFNSQRMETVEGVATLLNEAGIQVRISNHRSYHSKRSGQFSYLDRNRQEQHPTVWIVHANDQPRAREILRKVGLLDTTRRNLSDAKDALASPINTIAPRLVHWTWRIRLTLLLVIGAIAVMITLHHSSNPIATPPTPIPTQQPAKPQHEEPVRVQIQPIR